MAPSIVLDPAQQNGTQAKTPFPATSTIISQPTKGTTITTPLPNPSLQVTADHNLKQVGAPVYAPGVGEVLLHIKATGVCG